MSCNITINTEVVQKKLHKVVYIILKDLVDDPLVCRWSIFQTKRHQYPYIFAPFGNEGGLVLIVCMNVDLVITGKTVDEGVCCILNNYIENLVREW